MFTIYLNDLRLYAYHGLYEEEKETGNLFEVNAAVTIAPADKVGQLSQTVDYVAIFNIIERRMQIPTPLLETLAQELIEEIHQYDGRIETISISIKKINPPIQNFAGSVSVALIKHFTIK